MNLLSFRTFIFYLVFTNSSWAALTDIKFSRYQIADSQWNVSACLNTTTCQIYSKNPGTAYRIPWTNGQLSWATGDYVQFSLSGDASFPYTATQYNSDGTVKSVLGNGKIPNIGPDYFFFVGSDNNTGQLFSGSLGMNSTAGVTWTGTLNPTIAQADAYATSGYSLTPLAAGATVTPPSAPADITSGVTTSLSDIPSTRNAAFDGGTLSLTNGQSSSTDFTISSNNGTVSISSGSAQLSGIISGVGQLTKSGAGTLVLSGNNTYQGGTVITAGTLSVSSNSNLGNTSGAITLSGGTLLASDTFTTTRNISVTSASSISVASGKTLTDSGVVSGSSGLTKLGTGTLNLNGVNTYTGTFSVSEGTLNIGSASSNTSSQLLGNINISSGATLGGYGTLGSTGKTITNSGTIKNGSDFGTISVAGNYTQASSGTLLIKLSPSNTDVLNVAGVATLDGGLRISPSSGSYSTARYTILTANSISGVFDSLTNLRPSLNFSIGYDATSVYLDYVSNRDVVASLASSANKKIANQVTTSLGESSSLVQQLSSSSSEVVDRAMRQMTPLGTNVGGVTTGKVTNVVTNIVFEKAGTFTGDFSSIRDTQNKVFESGTFLDILPSSNMTFQQLATSFAVNPVNYRKSLPTSNKFIGVTTGYDEFVSGEFGGWVQGYIDRGFGDTTISSLGFDNKTHGVIGAAEYALSPTVLLGLFVSQSKTTSDFYESSGDMRVDQTQAGFYVQKILNAYKFSGSISTGKQKYQNKRNISLANVSALSSYDGRSYQGSLGVSKLSKLNKISIEPFGLFSYSKTLTDGYSETGATSGSDNYNLSVDKSKSSVGSLTSGIAFTIPFELSKKDAEFRLKPAVRYSDELTKPLITTAFVGSSTTSQYDSRRIDTWVGILTTELSLRISKSSSFKLGGEYQEGKTYDSYRLFGQYDWKF